MPASQSGKQAFALLIFCVRENQFQLYNIDDNLFYRCQNSCRIKLPSSPLISIKAKWYTPAAVA